MATVVPARRRRFRLIVILSTLILLLLVSGQVSQLGSDNFETKVTTEFIPIVNDSITIYENVFRGGSVNLPRDFSEADIDEYQRSVAAGEGTVVKATGLSYGGKTSWLKFVTRDINGRINTEGRSTENPPSEEPENSSSFFRTTTGTWYPGPKPTPPTPPSG